MKVNDILPASHFTSLFPGESENESENNMYSEEKYVETFTAPQECKVCIYTYYNQRSKLTSNHLPSEIK